MDESFLKSVENFLRDTAAGREQKREAYRAAEQVAAAPGSMGDTVRSAFWTWLTSGQWLKFAAHLGADLQEESPLNADKIRENYPTIKSFKEAEEKAIAAYNRRVSRALEHARAGWSEHEWTTFIYSRPEHNEIKGKLRESAASLEAARKAREQVQAMAAGIGRAMP
jgi:hypothetical protein